MPVMYVKRYEREDAKANPQAFYLFGDNCIRKGYGGQAAAMRGEPNALGVRTKWAPGMRDEDFFSDDDYERICVMIYRDMEKARNALLRGAVVVIPLDGLGSGLSELPKRAPKINKFLGEQLDILRRLSDTYAEPKGAKAA